MYKGLKMSNIKKWLKYSLVLLAAVGLLWGFSKPVEAETVTVQGVNSAPTVTASSLDGAISLSWPPVLNAQMYRYRVQQTGQTWGSWNFIGLNTSVTVNGLTNGVQYSIAVGTKRNDVWRNEWTIVTLTPSQDSTTTPPDNTDGGGDGTTTPPQATLELHDYAQELGVNSIPSLSSSFNRPCVADLNGDGRLDILWSQHKVKPLNVFYGNAQNTFTRQTNNGVVQSDNHGCAVADFDHDGRLDIFAQDGACNGSCLKTDRLYMQLPKGTYKRKDWLMGPQTYDRSRSSTVLDVNNDGWMDVFVTASAGIAGTGSQGPGSTHRILINQGLNSKGVWAGLKETTMGVERSHWDADCAEAADLDNDGYTDIVACETQEAFFYKNNGGQNFTAYPLNFSMDNLHGVTFKDINKDGWVDMLLAYTDRFELRYNDHGTFDTAALTVPLKFGFDVVTPDIDGDGDYDIYIIQALSNQDPASDGAHVLYLQDSSLPDVTWQRVNVPQPIRGAGDKAAVLPNFRGSGKDAVLIGNGGQWDTHGPRQVIALSGL